MAGHGNRSGAGGPSKAFRIVHPLAVEEDRRRADSGARLRCREMGGSLRRVDARRQVSSNTHGRARSEIIANRIRKETVLTTAGV